eukprot:TRINITY_DN23871_c0_g1_i1.p1 TRINITY_DN23871_c0_g1~~TRINITY_DN23871_c0_g1_i1.p1  ORF type:complete len:416 (-),score=67.32 TRINITY_DN23871_c0_g1_i1:736-1953(-)
MVRSQRSFRDVSEADAMLTSVYRQERTGGRSQLEVAAAERDFRRRRMRYRTAVNKRDPKQVMRNLIDGYMKAMTASLTQPGSLKDDDTDLASQHPERSNSMMAPRDAKEQSERRSGRDDEKGRSESHPGSRSGPRDGNERHPHTHAHECESGSKDPEIHSDRNVLDGDDRSAHARALPPSHVWGGGESARHVTGRDDRARGGTIGRQGDDDMARADWAHQTGNYPRRSAVDDRRVFSSRRPSASVSVGRRERSPSVSHSKPGDVDRERKDTRGEEKEGEKVKRERHHRYDRAFSTRKDEERRDSVTDDTNERLFGSQKREHEGRSRGSREGTGDQVREQEGEIVSHRTSLLKEERVREGAMKSEKKRRYVAVSRGEQRDAEDDELGDRWNGDREGRRSRPRASRE